MTQIKVLLESALPSLLADKEAAIEAANVASAKAAQVSLDAEQIEISKNIVVGLENPESVIFPDAVSEWWAHPVATVVSRPYERTLFGGISTDGKIFACEYAHATKKTKKYQVGTAVVDDHCAPALYAEEGRRSLIAWTNHNADNFIRVRVGSLSGDISMWMPEVTFNLGAVASYTQIHKIKSESDTAQDTFLMFSRYNTTFWGILTFSVNQNTGTLTITRAFRTILNGTADQSYISTADAYNASGDQVIRVAFTYNPAATKHNLHYFEINIASGAVSSPITPALTGNAFTSVNMPIIDTSLTPLVAEVANESRRLFYVRSGPLPPAIAFADWLKTSPDAAIYKVISATPGGAFDGLDTGATLGYASTAYKSAFNLDDFDLEVCHQLNVNITNTVDLARRRSSSADGWAFQLRADRKLSFIQTNATGTARSAFSTNAVPIAWSEKTYLRAKLRNNVSGNSRVYFEYSPDGATWTALDTGGVNLGAATTSLVTTHPFIIPSNSTNPFVTPNSRFFYVKLTNISGVDIINVNFTNKPSGQNSFTDSTGNVWELFNSATIVRSTMTWSTSTFGIAGKRIGYSSDANYIPGMCFNIPAYDDVVYVARESNGVSTIEEFRRNSINESYQNLVFKESDKKLSRPFAPVNGNIFKLIFSEFERYGSSFTDFLGNIRQIVR